MPAAALADHADRIVALATSGTADLDATRSALVTLLESAQHASRADRDDAVVRLSAPIATVDLPHAGALALGCGALVELGADLAPMAQPTLARMEEAVAATLPFVEACVALAREQPPQEQAAHHHHHEGDDEQDKDEHEDEARQTPIALYGEQVGERMPLNYRAHWALDLLSAATLAVLARSKAQRREMRGRTTFVEQVGQLDALGAAPDCLPEMLRVLDDEAMVVLHPGEQRGYEIVISGIGNNFQLHTLLAGALIGDPAQGWLPGEPPTSEEVAYVKDAPIDDPDELPSAHGFFNLWNWTGLLADGQLAGDSAGQVTGSAHWIWNEGIPADILPFEGRRVILLSPPPYSRSWNGGRFFPAMAGELDVTRQLPTEEVRAWLERIASTPRPSPKVRHITAQDLQGDPQ